MNPDKEFYVRKRLGEVIYQEMRRKRMTQRQISLQIEGFSTSQINRVIHGGKYTIDTLLKVLDQLELEIDIKRKDGQ